MLQNSIKLLKLHQLIVYRTDQSLKTEMMPVKTPFMQCAIMHGQFQIVSNSSDNSSVLHSLHSTGDNHFSKYNYFFLGSVHHFYLIPTLNFIARINSVLELTESWIMQCLHF